MCFLLRGKHPSMKTHMFNKSEKGENEFCSTQESQSQISLSRENSSQNLFYICLQQLNLSF